MNHIPDRATRRNTYRRQRKLAKLWGKPSPDWHSHCIAAPPSKKPPRPKIEADVSSFKETTP